VNAVVGFDVAAAGFVVGVVVVGIASVIADVIASAIVERIAAAAVVVADQRHAPPSQQPQGRVDGY
jgi:hypothetical protein